MIEIKNLSFSYELLKIRLRIIKEIVFVLKDISFSINDNEFFCLIGPSGCGKSTLLKILAGFETPTTGEILDDGKKISGVSYERAMVFQEDAVFPWLNVHGNVEYGLKVRGISKEIREEKVSHAINLVGLKGFEKLLPRELSGGMKKRVDLARVLANEPKILLMDEPFGSLDAMTKEILQEKLINIWENSKKTILFITHDIEEALFLGDRIAIMQSVKNGGSVEFFNIPFKRPRNIYLKEEQKFQKMRRDLVELFKKYEI